MHLRPGVFLDSYLIVYLFFPPERFFFKCFAKTQCIFYLESALHCLLGLQRYRLPVTDLAFQDLLTLPSSPLAIKSFPDSQAISPGSKVSFKSQTIF